MMAKLVALFCLLAACHGDVHSPRMRPVPTSRFQRLPLADKVDILFMLDDSPSTLIVPSSLEVGIPRLLQRLDALGAGGFPVSYHLGVVTSDLGAGMAVNGGCAVGGRGAKLQALGVAHGPGCQPPTGGLHFLVHDQVTGSDNLPTGQTLQQTFFCMAAVGGNGCGFEHPMEAV
jgi:hypothetical protein